MSSSAVVTRDDVVRTARGYLGVRWHHQGRNRSGLDCIGLIIAVAHDLGLSEYDTTGYGRAPDGDALRRTLARHLTPLRRDPLPGDVLLFAFFRNPVHTAIATGPDTMIHAYANMRRVVEHRIDEVWRARFVAAYGFKEFD